MQTTERPPLVLTPPEPEQKREESTSEPPQSSGKSQISFWEDLLGKEITFFKV